LLQWQAMFSLNQIEWRTDESHIGDMIPGGITNVVDAVFQNATSAAYLAVDNVGLRRKLLSNTTDICTIVGVIILIATVSLVMRSLTKLQPN
jgi:lipoprotein signal peptidase